MLIFSTAAPPGNQAANGESKSQPVVSGETGLLESDDLGSLCKNIKEAAA